MKFMLLALLLPSFANAFSYDLLHPIQLAPGTYQVDCRADSIQSRSCFGFKGCLPLNGGQNFSGAYDVNGRLQVSEQASQKTHIFEGQVTLFQKIKKDWGGSFTETQENFDLKSSATMQISDLGEGKTQITSSFHSEKSDDRRGTFNDKIFQAPKKSGPTEVHDVTLVSTSKDAKGMFYYPTMSDGDEGLVEMKTIELGTKNDRKSISRFDQPKGDNGKSGRYFYGLDETSNSQVRSQPSMAEKYDSVELHFNCYYTPIE